MSLEKINIRTWLIVLIISVFSIFRVLSPEKFGLLANFTPVGAIALFGGVYFKKKWQALTIPLLILFASDIFINYSYFNKFVLFYEGAFWVYLSFLLIVLLGTVNKKVKMSSLILSSFLAVVIHWLVSDFGVWLGNPAFAQTPKGFIECLVLAIPFMKNFLIGTLLYSTVLFGGFEFIRNKFPNLALA